MIPSNDIKALFLHAREVTGPDRALFLDELRNKDPQAAQRLERLLDAEVRLGDLALRPLIADEPGAERVPGYELIERVGAGGFAVVYRARRAGGAGHDVAVKVLRTGLDDAESVARFRLEQQALEALDHPGVARVIDAGVTALGRPFLVMEYVAGEPLDLFLDGRRATVAERLALFTEVCRAVQHAHQRGVVHRDLKPGNVLATEVDGRWHAKVIDFGVAKWVRAPGRPGVTRLLSAVGTPAYMSPEQAQGAAGGVVDTRSDVYALGAMLYELLCGEPVVDVAGLSGASAASIERAVCAADPPAPSRRALGSPRRDAIAAARGTDPKRLAGVLRGELDWITRRAIEKDRERRYPSAESLARDLERAARGEPVEAAPASRLYRFRRAVSRNPGVSLGVVVAVTALLAATAVSLTAMVRARQAEQAAREQTEIADAVNRFLTRDVLAAAIPAGDARPDAGPSVTMLDVLNSASAKIDAASAPGGAFEGKPAVQAAVRRAIGQSYYALGQHAPAHQHQRAAAELFALARGPDDRDAIEMRLASGWSLRELNRFAEAEEIFRLAAADSQRAFGPRDPLTLDAQSSIAAVLYWGAFRLGEAETMYRRLIGDFREAVGSDDRRSIAAEFNLGRVLLDRASPDPAEAEHWLDDATRRNERVLGATHPSTLWCRTHLARAVEARDPPAARRLLISSLIDHLRVLGPSCLQTLATMRLLADGFARDGRLIEAWWLLGIAAARMESSLGPDHLDTVSALGALASVEHRLGLELEARRRLAGAIDRSASRFGAQSQPTAMLLQIRRGWERGE